jgi:hypothetical protein
MAELSSNWLATEQPTVATNMPRPTSAKNSRRVRGVFMKALWNYVPIPAIVKFFALVVRTHVLKPISFALSTFFPDSKSAESHEG